MERDEILLKEYEICHSDVAYNGNVFWLTMGIIFSINIAALGWIISNISDGFRISINQTVIFSKTTNWLGFIITSITMTIILLLFNYFLKRIQVMMSMVRDRMSNIEKEINATFNGVLKNNLIIRGLDSYYGKNDKEKSEYVSLADSLKYDVLVLSHKYQKQPLHNVCKWIIPRKSCNSYSGPSRHFRSYLLGFIMFLWFSLFVYSLFQFTQSIAWTLPLSIIFLIIVSLSYIYTWYSR